jgi:hypothetical protein
MARHGFVDPDDATAVRRLSQTLTALVAAYSNKHQTIRVRPVAGGSGRDP